MAFDLVAPLDRIIALVEAVPNCVALKAVPESISEQLTGYVTLADINVIDKNNGLLQLDANYRVIFAYRISGNEAGGENGIAAAVVSFINGFYVDRKTDLNGTVESATINLSLGGAREYAVYAGQEFREYPIIVGITQTQNLP